MAMANAAVTHPPRVRVPGDLPGSRLPGLVQGFRYARDPIGFYSGLQRRYGNVFQVSFPYFKRIVYVADPAIVKRVFTGDPDQFRAGEANATVLEPAVGPSSVLTLDGAEHLRQRKVLLPPFHGERVKRYGEVIRDAAERDIDTWPSGRPFSLRPHMQAVTLEVILRAVFGLRSAERSRIAAKLVADFAHRADLVTQIPALRRNLGRNSPWERFKRSRDRLDAFILDEIADRRAQPDAAERDDVLSLLLAAKHDDGSPMSDRELRDELVTVLGAGHETTATALAWAFERLLRNPRALARLRESVGAGEDEYLDATIQETLRARPVIVDVARRLSAPAEVGGYDLPAGTFVLPAIAAMHYREDLFPRPFEFRPERFIEGGADTYTWIPFGGGVRRCVGAAFAQYEMRVIMRAILERTELRAPDQDPERVRLRNITLAPGRGTRVELVARR
jgi:cytochrome P450 family 135